MKNKINISYICVSRLLGEENFILLKERFDFGKLLDGSNYPFSYYNIKDDYKTKYNSDDIEEAYDYKELLGYKKNMKLTKKYLLARGLEKAEAEIAVYKRHGINSGARLK